MPDSVGLRMIGIFQSKPLDQLLGTVAARAFGKDRDLGVQVVARLEVGLGLALLVDTLVIGANAYRPRFLRREVPIRRTR